MEKCKRTVTAKLDLHCFTLDVERFHPTLEEHLIQLQD